jgi:aminomethyltransferase
MSSETPKRTPLYAWHAAHGGRLVEFGGWAMPVQYSTIVEEHQAVRRHAGVFDISHMGRLQFEGPDAEAWLERATTNHVARLAPGQIQYSLMANDAGGLVDDVLVYRMPDGVLGMVCNASNRGPVLARLASLRGDLDARLTDRTEDLAMIAVQGPEALAIAAEVIDAPLASTDYYHLTTGQALGARVLASRTGYTGEDGFEVVIRAALAERFWDALLDAGSARGGRPCGLGARDTLRFEAAMPLYGHELAEDISPYEAGVGWAVKLSKGEFAGREALKAAKRNPARTRVGLALEGKRVARQGAVVSDPEGRRVGVVTSGTFSPTLGKSLAMALVEPTAAGPDAKLVIDVRGTAEPARVVPLPFYRRASL